MKQKESIKIIFHKYASSVDSYINVLEAKQANYKKGEERKKKGKIKLWFPAEALFSGSFVVSL